MTIKKECVEHRRKAPDTSNISLIEKHKQAAFVFSEACHVMKCHHKRDGPEQKELSVLLRCFKGDGLPTQKLSNKLKEVIPDVSHFTTNDFLYIESCLMRFHRGVPIDVDKLARCRKQLLSYKDDFNKLCGLGVIKIYEGNDLTIDFNHPLFATQLNSSWPREDDGTPTLDWDVLKGLAIPFAQSIYRAMCYFYSKSLLNFTVSPSGLHHFYANPFAATTGREAPRGNAFIYIPKETRNYILWPRPGNQIFILDYVAQEVGAVAALAGDKELWSAYEDGDVYLELKSRSTLFLEMPRRIFKVLCISHLYGMTVHGIKKKFHVSAQQAQQWYSELRLIFEVVNRYLDIKVTRAIAEGIATVKGYSCLIESFRSKESIRNFYVQATCAKILHKLCLLLDESNLKTIFCIHDSVSCSAPLHDEKAQPLTEKLMGDASESLLGPGYRLRVECEYFNKNN